MGQKRYPWSNMYSTTEHILSSGEITTNLSWLSHHQQKWISLRINRSAAVGFRSVLRLMVAWCFKVIPTHYNDVIMGAMASQITSLTIIYSSIYSDADERKHQSSVSLAFVQGIHWWPVNSLYKRPVTWKMFLFDDIFMCCCVTALMCLHFYQTITDTILHRMRVIS